MTIIVELREHKPGYAEIEIKRWNGSREIEIAVQRNQDRYYLKDGEQWNTEPVWHRVSDLTQNETLKGIVGPWLVDPLIKQAGNSQFLLIAKDSNGLEDQGVIRLSGNILASSASGDSSREQEVRNAVNEEPKEEPKVETIDEPAVNEQIIEQTTEPEPVIADEIIQEPAPVIDHQAPKSAGGKSRSFGIIILLALLIIGGIVAWFFMQGSSQSPESASNSACTVKSGEDEISFIQSCLKTNPDTKQILNIIENAKKENACGVAQRLYANKAQGGNAEIAFAYAKEYDSAFSKGDGCFKLDKDTAVYWYETGLSADPNNAEAKQRLEELKK